MDLFEHEKSKRKMPGKYIFILKRKDKKKHRSKYYEPTHTRLLFASEHQFFGDLNDTVQKINHKP